LGKDTTENTSKVSDNETTPYSETEVDGSAFGEETELGETDLHTEQRATVEPTHIREDFAGQHESSFPAEISQVSFDSDISFEDEISNSAAQSDSNLDVPTSGRATQPQQTADPQAKTAINPNLPKAASRQPTPSIRMSPQTPSMMEVRAAEMPPRKHRLPMVLVFLIFSSIAGYLALKHFGVDIRSIILGQQPVTSTPSATPTPQPVVEKMPIPQREITEIEAAISFLTKDSLDYACARLRKYLPNAIVQAKISYCLSINWLFFGNKKAGEEARSISTAALLGGVRSIDVVFASGAMLAREQVNNFDENLKQWNLPDSFDNEPDYNFLLSIAAFEKGRFDRAKKFIEKATEIKPNFGPYLVFDKKIFYAMNNLPPKSIDTSLVGLRNEILKDFPSFKVFLQKTVIKKPSRVKKPKPTRTKTKPKFRPKPKPKPTPKPRPTPVKQLDPLKQLIELGDGHFRNERYNQALKSYQAAEKLGDGKDAALLTRLGNTWFRTYRLDEAFATYSKALELDPNQADAHKGLGRVFDHLGDTDQAIREFSIYLQLNPKAKDAATIRNVLNKLKQ
jgi:tetratricopeptide (TPR) repeat protein